MDEKKELLLITEKPRERRSPHRRRLSRQYASTPRICRIIVAAVVLLYLSHAFIDLLLTWRDKMKRDRPTDFAPLLDTLDVQPWAHSHDLIRYSNGTHIADRYVYMRELGRGHEGKAALYVDMEAGKTVVVKTYFLAGSADLPAPLAEILSEYTSRWPNELEATLLLGNTRNGDKQVFVPVHDFFILASSTWDWNWVMVTPFIESGTLHHLAARLRPNRMSPGKLDQIYRSVLHSLLSTLALVHERGYCHNDVKADNVFALSDQHWLLGDLGQVREQSHSWFTTKTWKKQNQWSDCMLNDVRRMLKTYITFLKLSSTYNAEDFDRAFLRGEEPWSALYWAWMEQPVGVEATIALSRRVGYGLNEVTRTMRSTLSECMARSVEQELRCITLRTHWDDFWTFRHC